MIQVGSILAFIFMIAISSIIKNLEKTNKVKRRKLQGESKKSIVQSKHIQDDEKNTVKSMDVEHDKTSSNAYNRFLEKAQKQESEGKVLKNFEVARKQKSNSFYQGDFFASNQLLKAVVLKEILDPPKAFSRKGSNMIHYKYY